MKKFSEIAKANSFLESIPISKVIGKEIIVYGYEIRTSKHPRENSPNCIMLRIELDHKRCCTFSGSSLLQRQAEECKDEFPFATTLKFVGRWLSFS
nr:MAG TPA: hypothetical protein [Caudoviricetes sp.]